MKTRYARLLTCPLACFLAGSAAYAQEFVPFVIPQQVPQQSLIAQRGQAITVDTPRIVARDGHFYRADGTRYRAWGVNLCFGANFPTHENAQSTARRLEAFGINSVRIHHMDANPFPGGIWDEKDQTRLSSEALDRLDYLIDQLAQRGITTNLNLHVSRTHSRFLKLPDSTPSGNYNKIVDLFTPQLIEAQKAYARDLLGHVNPYRKVTYAADPAITFVEINNEDSLFMWDWEKKIQAMPAFYADILKGRFNQWLKQRYQSRQTLALAWKGVARPAVEPLSLPQTKEAAARWIFETSGPSKATRTPLPDADGVRITIEKLGSAGWHLQYNHANLSLQTDSYYTLRFRARADEPRSLTARFTQAQSPYRPLGFSRDIKLAKEWKDFELSFAATVQEMNARLSFVFGGSTVPFEIADLSLACRPLQGLNDAEDPAAGTVAFVSDGDTTPRRADRLRFLAEIEKAYWQDMRQLIRDELQCKALVTGTIIFGPAGLWTQSGMDFIDTHAYWSHPRFPGKPWSPTDWTVEQRSMVDFPDENRFNDLAASRIAGKPFTVTEYNHAAPNDFQAECIPLIATIAAAQDWDGVWIFDYAAREGTAEAGFYNNYFSIDRNPAKFGFMPAGAAIFRDALLPPLAAHKVYRYGDSQDLLSDLVSRQDRHGLAMSAALGRSQGDKSSILNERIAVSLGDTPAAPAAAGATLSWQAGRFEARGDKTWVLIETGKAQEPSKFQPGFAVLTATSMDGRPLADSAKVLLTLAARCENGDMKFTPDRRSVGKDWGKAPVRIEAPALQLPWKSSTPLMFTPLKPDATAGASIQLQPAADGNVLLPLGPNHQTMWYLLTRP